MKIKKIEAQNFRSWNKLELDLEKPNGLVVVTGLNGNGKSSAFYTLIYALYGELPDGSKGDDVVKQDKGKDTYARVIFTHLNHEYEITRYRKDKKYKNKVIVKQDGKDVTLSTNKETDQKILEILGFGFDTLLNSIIFSPERLNSFINATDKHRKEILEELTNTNIYKQAEQLIKEDSKEAQNQLNLAQKELQRLIDLSKTLNALESNYRQSRDMWNRNYNQLTKSIKELKTKLLTTNLDEIKQSLAEAQAGLNKVKSKLKTVPAPDNTKINQLKNKLTTLKSQLEMLKQSINDDIATYQEVQSSDDATCELCGSKLDDQHKQTELTNLKQRIAKNVDKYKAGKNQLLEMLPKYQQLENEYQKAQTAYQKNNREQESNMVAYQQFNQNINRLTQQQNDYLQTREQWKQAQEQLTKLEQNPIVKPNELTQHHNLKQSQEEQQTKVEKLQKDLQDYADLKHVYSDKGVKAQALSVVIPYLNVKLHDCLDILTNGTLTAELTSKTKTKSGKVNEQINLIVSSATSGNEYHELSSGEKKRIGIALNIAFMQYLQSQIGGLNFVVFDELMDNLDQDGIHAVMNYLNSLKSSIDNIFLISHNEGLQFNDNCDKIYRVNKINNYSVLECQ